MPASNVNSAQMATDPRDETGPQGCGFDGSGGAFNPTAANPPTFAFRTLAFRGGEMVSLITAARRRRARLGPRLAGALAGAVLALALLAGGAEAKVSGYSAPLDLSDADESARTPRLPSTPTAARRLSGVGTTTPGAPGSRLFASMRQETRARSARSRPPPRSPASPT